MHGHSDTYDGRWAQAGTIGAASAASALADDMAAAGAI